MDLSVVSFFCGAGGMDLGFVEAGFEIKRAWDFDKYAVQTYKENVGGYVEQRDIIEQTWEEIPAATVWTFGFPCTDLSISGKMQGMKLKCQDCQHEFDAKKSGGSVCPVCQSKNTKPATRSGLFFEVMRLLEEVKENAPDRLPAFLVAENVAQLRPYLPVLREEYRKRGYQMKHAFWNSKYWGVPQSRERYFVVGIREDLNLDFRFPKEQHDFVPKLSSILEPVVDENYYLPDEKAQKIIEQALQRIQLKGVHAALTPDRIEKRQNGRRAKDDEEPMFTLTAQDLHGVIVGPEINEYGKQIPEVCPFCNNDEVGWNEEFGAWQCGNCNHVFPDNNNEHLLENFLRRFIYQLPRGFNQGGVHEIAPTLTANSYQLNNFVIDSSKPRDIPACCGNPNCKLDDEIGWDEELGTYMCQCGYVFPAHTMVALEPQRDSQQPNIKVLGLLDKKGFEKQRRVYSPYGISPTLIAGEGGGHEPKVLVREDSPQPDISVIGRLDIKGHDYIKRVYDSEGLAPTLPTAQGGSQEPKILVIDDTYGFNEVDARVYDDLTPTLRSERHGLKIMVAGVHKNTEGFRPQEIASTLDAHGYKGIQCNQLRPAVAEIYPRYRVRKLTPTEYGRLQGFPVHRWKQVVSNSQAYKQFGNAVSVPCSKAIAEAIKACIIGKELECEYETEQISLFG